MNAMMRDNEKYKQAKHVCYDKKKDEFNKNKREVRATKTIHQYTTWVSKRVSLLPNYFVGLEAVDMDGETKKVVLNCATAVQDW